jgi:hypothetical protein
MSLTAIFHHLESNFPNKSVKWAGPDNFRHMSDFPRIAWVPVGGPAVPPQRGSGRGQDAGELGVRAVTCAVSLWHRTVAEIEALLAEFVNVLQNEVSQHTYRLQSESWELGGESTRGMACVLYVEIKVPILREKPMSVTLDSIVITSTSMSSV